MSVGGSKPSFVSSVRALTPRVWVTTDTEGPLFREVMRLRLAANIAAHKLPADTDASRVRDEFDSSALIYVVFRHGVPVGSCRVVPNPETTGYEFDAISGSRAVFPDLNRCVGASRACVSPDAQRAGLFALLHDLVVLGCVDLGRRFLIAAAEGWMVNVYVRRGWIDTGFRYASRVYGGIEHRLMYLDTQSYIAGWDASGQRFRDDPPNAT